MSEPDPSASDDAPGAPPVRQRNWPAPALVAVAAVAVALSSYLTWISVQEAAAPAGCGPDSGCARVLASQWSRWFNVPVGAPATALYVATCVAAGLAWRSVSDDRRRVAWGALVTLAALAAGAAAWFVLLQALVIRTFCPWCLALHACGILCLVLVGAGISSRRLTAPGAPVIVPPATAPTSMTAGRVRAHALFGVVGLGVLVAGQLMSTPTRREIRLSALPGVTVIPSDHPMLGSPDAKHVVVVLADYTCPHCRELHHQLDAALSRYGREQLAVAVAPVPLNSNCNDAIKYTEMRMSEACELARIALAVWTADPTKYGDIDEWLFSPALPPSASDAREHAAKLVGADALDRALADAGIARRIAANVRLYRAAGTGRLPKLLLPSHTASGAADSPEALFELLEKHLGLAVPASQPTRAGNPSGATEGARFVS